MVTSGFEFVDGNSFPVSSMHMGLGDEDLMADIDSCFGSGRRSIFLRLCLASVGSVRNFELMIKVAGRLERESDCCRFE
jgi:hypothetical protein